MADAIGRDVILTLMSNMAELRESHKALADSMRDLDSAIGSAQAATKLIIEKADKHTAVLERAIIAIGNLAERLAAQERKVEDHERRLQALEARP